MFQLLHHCYWWVRRRRNAVGRHGNVDIIFIDAAASQTRRSVAKVVEDAFGEVSRAKGGFGELVMSHLRFVAAKRVKGSFAMPAVQGFVSPFEGPEGSDARYLAARLVWAATYIRLYRDAAARGRVTSRDGIRRAAYDAQLRFLQLLPDTEELQNYLGEFGP